ncbi:hypothetical protein [Streptomyces sp. NPDC002962]|uniref:hypothetical protein n=1 Tax=Streptomyces sp. NPDC002962 TaxID=3364674 RepID=UPI00368C2795
MLAGIGLVIKQHHHRPLGVRDDGQRTTMRTGQPCFELLRSRRGTGMTQAFPEIQVAALTQLPTDTGLDGTM